MHLYGGTTTTRKVKRKQNVHLNYLGLLLLLLLLRAYRHRGIAFWSNRGGNDTDDEGNQVVAECVNETKERGLFG